MGRKIFGNPAPILKREDIGLFNGCSDIQSTSVTVTVVGVVKCHSSGLALYLMIFRIRRSFLGQKQPVTVADCH